MLSQTGERRTCFPARKIAKWCLVVVVVVANHLLCAWRLQFEKQQEFKPEIKKDGSKRTDPLKVNRERSVFHLQPARISAVVNQPSSRRFARSRCQDSLSRSSRIRSKTQRPFCAQSLRSQQCERTRLTEGNLWVETEAVWILFAQPIGVDARCVQ